MGIISSLFGKKQSASGMPAEMAGLFEKIASLLEDEKLQNSMNHELIQEKINGGIDADQLPGAAGEFGRCVDNPIPVNGAIGELAYLSLLKTTDTEQRLLFHRLGSVESLDIYETVTIDGSRWDIFFMSMYHPRKSRKSPVGYEISAIRDQPLLYGTNKRLENFPYGLQEAIGETTELVIGIPLPPPQVRIAEENVQFQRSSEHQAAVTKLIENVQGFGA